MGVAVPQAGYFCCLDGEEDLFYSCLQVCGFRLACAGISPLVGMLGPWMVF